MKYLFKRDTFLATLSIFFVLGLLLLIPLNVHFLDPLKLAVSDLSFNDLSYSALKSHRSNELDDKLVIVNIGNADRRDITEVLNRMCSSNAKAIGLDVLFLDGKDPIQDTALAGAIHRCPNLVISDKIRAEGDSIDVQDYFEKDANATGYVNFIGENRGVIRYFSPFEKVEGKSYNSFSASIVKLVDIDRFHHLQRRGNPVELINYQRQADQYVIIRYEDLLAGKVAPTAFFNKIVLIGYVNANVNDIEDKHFTPLNEKFVGKSIPDMNGVVIHANIITMILEKNYINKVPLWLNLIIAVFFAWILMSFKIKMHQTGSIWGPMIVKTFILLLSVLLVYLGILMGKDFNIYANFGIILVPMVFATDVLVFYESFALWLHKKYKFKTIFAHHKH